MKLMLYVQHLLGIGHLVRASRISQALADAGHDVCVVSGGLPVDGLPPSSVRLEQLAPLRCEDGDFATLLDEHGSPVDKCFKQRRRDRLIAVFDAMQPDCLVIEAFPFARRQMRFELLPLLDHVHALPLVRRPLVVSSVRDILQPRSPQRDVETAALVNELFDLVLVHGEAPGRAFLETFSESAAIQDKVEHSGLVGPVRSHLPAEDRQFDVIVSAGGGAVGARLLHAALGARPLSRFAGNCWLLVTGPNLPDGEFSALLAKAVDGVSVVRFEPGLPALLAGAQVSVSQAGYNTVAEVLSAGCGSVLVPYEAGGEREQVMRAGRLAQAGQAVMVREDELDPARLAYAINVAAALPRPAQFSVRLDGAEQSVRILEAQLAAFKAGSRSGTQPADGLV